MSVNEFTHSPLAVNKSYAAVSTFQATSPKRHSHKAVGARLTTAATANQQLCLCTQTTKLTYASARRQPIAAAQINSPQLDSKPHAKPGTQLRQRQRQPKQQHSTASQAYSLQ